MTIEKPTYSDVSVIGAGPTGIAACLEISKHCDARIDLFESESEIGGIPRRCHLFFGMRDLKRIYTGPTYVDKLEKFLHKTAVTIHTNAAVVKIIENDASDKIRINVSSPRGFLSYESRFLIIATGCFERSRGARLIPGTRPAGILTTGALHDWVNIRGKRPGKKALIIGSEYVSLSGILSLKKTGASIAGLMEESESLRSNPLLVKAMSTYCHFPIFKNTSLKAIMGNHRVERVELESNITHASTYVDCDTVIITGGFQPDIEIIYNTGIKQDSNTLSPVVNKNFMTSRPNVFAAGNIVGKTKMHDRCALEGRRVAKHILKKMGSGAFP